MVKLKVSFSSLGTENLLKSANFNVAFVEGNEAIGIRHGYSPFRISTEILIETFTTCQDAQQKTGPGSIDFLEKMAWQNSSIV